MNLDWPTFIGITLVLFGFAAFMTGQAIAATWRPAGWVVAYCLMLGAADRFVVWSLFGGELSSIGGYLTDAAALTGIGLVAYLLTRARKMESQYPWMIKRTSPFTWRRIDDEWIEEE